MTDSPTAQLPLLIAVEGDRDSVTVSPAVAGLTEGLTSTAMEARTPEEESNVHYPVENRLYNRPLVLYNSMIKLSQIHQPTLY